ncbi:MAG: methyltransferase domain-containing protein [Candidatus Delongbacteria bacterium]|nr:methyltransferase domain-containing protein [Candidatus Delongbacteria bacterium]MBN2834817.1 methyltransferase domain-containing protein [Candidatus Delongbacteria bacterium]
MVDKDKAFTKAAKYYDRVMQDFSYQDLVDYLDDLIIENGGERTNVLSIACGTAEELSYFHQLGYQIEGLDISEGMLEVAREKLPFAEFHHSNMTNFSLEDKFDNIVSTFDSINYILDDEELEKCFRSVHKNLNREGLFLFDFNTLYTFIHEWEGVRSEIGDDYEIIYESKFNYDNMIADVDIRFYMKNEDGVDFFEERHREKGYTYDMIKKSLIKSGFKVIKIVPFFKKRKGQETNIDRYQVVARKIGD